MAGHRLQSIALTIARLTFTVNQSNFGCSFTIAPTSVTFPLEGGGGSVSFMTVAGCAWQAISNDPWIKIEDGSSGVGNGSVDYTVQPNLTGSPRTGTATIAGQTFTVNQTEISAPSRSEAAASRLYPRAGPTASRLTLRPTVIGPQSATIAGYISLRVLVQEAGQLATRSIPARASTQRSIINLEAFRALTIEA